VRKEDRADGTGSELVSDVVVASENVEHLSQDGAGAVGPATCEILGLSFVCLGPFQS